MMMQPDAASDGRNDTVTEPATLLKFENQRRVVVPSISIYETAGLGMLPIVYVPGPGRRTERLKILVTPEAFTAANPKDSLRQIAGVCNGAVNWSLSTTALIDPSDVVDPGGGELGDVGMFLSNLRSPQAAATSSAAGMRNLMVPPMP